MDLPQPLEAATMADNEEIPSKTEFRKAHENLLSFLPKFPFKFPTFGQELKVQVVVEEEPRPAKTAATAREDENEIVTEKPDVVRFSDRPRPIIPPPLKLEPEEVEANEKSSNPTVLWQVYALGGFIILKWLYAKYKEKKAKNGSADDQQPPRSPVNDD